jgi:hypothetical protein
MPFYRIGGSMVHLKLSGKAAKNPPAPCCAPIELEGKRVRCMGISQYLCDWPVDGGKTCDAPLCEEHATQIGPDRHLCPRHASERGAA